MSDAVPVHATPLARDGILATASAFLPTTRWGNRWHYHYTRAKLRSDPLFPAVRDALRGSTVPLLDIGCGIGLLAHVLRGDGQSIAYRGVDIDAIKIRHARRAMATAELHDVGFDAIDLTRGLPAHRGSVAILDVLQYLDANAQRALLDAAIAMLVPGARLVIRAALDDGRQRSRTTRLTDWIGHLSGWMQSRPRHYPHADSLRARFTAAGLEARFSPLHGKTPFNHWLVVAENTASPHAGDVA